MQKIAVIGALIAVLLISVLVLYITGFIASPFCREVTEEYQEEESYTAYLNAEVIDDKKIEVTCPGTLTWCAKGIVELKNTDDQGAWFTVTYHWEAVDDSWTNNIEHFINPDETVEFISIYDIYWGQNVTFTYTYTSDLVTKTRMVTKTRTVEKCD